MGMGRGGEGGCGDVFWEGAISLVFTTHAGVGIGSCKIVDVLVQWARLGDLRCNRESEFCLWRSFTSRGCAGGFPTTAG